METKMRPVDVISVCSAEGQLRPLRIRIAEGNGELFRVDIDRVISTREISYVGVEATIFLCSATVWERKWLFELKYLIRSHTWYLLRKIQG